MLMCWICGPLFLAVKFSGGKAGQGEAGYHRQPGPTSGLLYAVRVPDATEEATPIGLLGCNELQSPEARG